MPRAKIAADRLRARLEHYRHPTAATINSSVCRHLVQSPPWRRAATPGPAEAGPRVAGDLGPGIVTGAADDDPSGIATYSQAGAQFGYGLLWTMLLTYPLMAAVQLVSAHIGRVTGNGLAQEPRPHLSRARWSRCSCDPADRQYLQHRRRPRRRWRAAAQLVAGGGEHIFVHRVRAWPARLLQLFVPYRAYANVLKWLTLSLFAYVGVVLLVHIDWRRRFAGCSCRRNLGKDALLTIVAVFGTTISPYLFFWQSSQEAEEIATTAAEAA